MINVESLSFSYVSELTGDRERPYAGSTCLPVRALSPSCAGPLVAGSLRSCGR